MCNFVILLYLKNGHNMLIAKKKYQINKIMNLLILKAIKFKPSIVFLGYYGFESHVDKEMHVLIYMFVYVVWKDFFFPLKMNLTVFI